MKRLRAIDRALLFGLVPLWALCVTLHAVRAFDDRVGWLPVQIEPGPSPVVSGIMPQAEIEGLQPGDVLLRAGDVDLAGAGRFGFWTRSWSAVDDAFGIDFTLRREGVESTARVPILKISYPLATLPLILCSGLVSIAILLRGRSRAEARAFFVAGQAHSLNWAAFFGPIPWQTGLSLGVALGSSLLLPAAVVYALLSFPQDVAPRSRWMRAWPLVFAALCPAVSSWLLGWPLPSAAGLQGVLAINAAMVVAALAVLAHHYVRTGPRGRRQLKWVLYGFYVGLIPVLGAVLLTRGQPELTWVYEVGVVFTALIPICTFVAIVRDDFLDIDRVITETTAYTLMLAFVAVLAPGIPAASRALGEQLGVEASAAQVFLILALGGGALAARSRLRPWLDATLFSSRRSLERNLSQLRDELVDLSDPGKVLKCVGERLDELLDPEGCVVYAQAGGAFGPVVALGASVPPSVDADGALAELLRKQGGPVPAREWRRWVREGLLSDTEAATLHALSPEAILPIEGDREVLAFVCLGPKRSGDIYTASELAWLGAVAERAAQRLVRFGDAELISRGRELQSKLARYVPGAIEEQLTEGREVAPAEREVSVLFVDIRGYTSFAERRTAEEIFRTVSEYTEAVSSIVIKQGGSVVEFHGDGVMVVFGAPHELADKERAAVLAAREITETVPRLDVKGARLSVGVGVATGPAFVGNIRSADRLIWGAIGNTTNLAARLQGMTRELDAAIAIDHRTRIRANDAARDFEDCGEREVHGRSEHQHVHALML